MKLLAYFRSLGLRLFRRSTVERQLEEELVTHVAMRAADLEKLGLTPREAERRAQLEFGSRESFKEQCREAVSGSLIDTLLQDLRFSLRTLAKQPGFAFIAIATLAMGIGMNTLMLSVVHDVLLRPLPYAHADRLYAIWAGSESAGQTHIAASGPDFLDYAEQNRSFEHLAEYLPRFTFTWTGDGEPQLVVCSAASEQFFAALGVHAYLGRLYEPREYTYLENDTLVVSYNFWKNKLGGDPHVIGRRVHFEGQNQTICGVLPPMPELFPDTDVWPKLTTRPSWPYMQWRGNKFLNVIGELKPGVSAAMAEQDLTTILRRAPEEPRDVRVHLVPLKQDLVGNVRLPLIITLSASSIILIVVCLNVAALLLARGVKRQTEMALRLSLGAGLARLAQQLMTEAAVLSGAGCALGLFIAWSTLRLLARLPALPLPRLDSVHLNLPAVTAAVAITTLITSLFGWLPVMSFSRLHLSSALRSRGVETGRRRPLSLPALVVAEIACSVVLTISVGLLVHSFWRVMHTSPGFESQSLLRAYLRTNYYDEKGRAFWKGVLTETASLPGVSSVALADWRPGRDAATATIVFEDRSNNPTRLPVAEASWISSDFFRALGTPVIAGRAFSDHDGPDTPPVVLINAAAAQQFWPNQNPVGKKIGINYTGPGRRPSAETPRLREVVGIVGNVKHGALDSNTEPAVYMPYLQDETNHDMATMSLFVRAEGKPGSLADAVRNRVHAVNAEQPVQVEYVQQLLLNSVATRRYTLELLGAFAAITLLLVVVGVYGVISYVTAQRTREFGVRIALGATRSRVISEVLRGGARLIALGSFVGLAGALIASRSLSALLFEVAPLDPLSYSAALAVLAAIAVCACLVPAWRASRVSPLIAMQSE